MSGEQAPLAGPDLTQGIDESSLVAGGSLLGHAHGEPVLVARIGDDVVAVGASCTHYGGPLAEGVIVGDEVRCPWHHACFSLRTGEALQAPALSPLPCYEVEREQGCVRVGARIDRDPLAPTYPVHLPERSGTQSMVIVGAGAAGSAAAEMLRRCGHTGSITVIDEDPDAPYDRPNLSKDYLAGNAPEEWIPLRPEGFHAAHDIEIVRAHAARVDVAGRRVELEGREPLPFDALLLATGAEPLRLPIEGAELPHVHYLRSLADSRAIIGAAQSARRVVIIGTSFIGLEVAASLGARGLQVHVVGPDSVPLERVLGRELGELVERLHREHGIVFHLGHTPERIGRQTVRLDDGTHLDADLVVIGVGVRPRVRLAETARLTLDRGVVVDEYLETSVPGIFAAGDLARWPDPHSGERIRVEHWVVAQRMGQTAARNMLGARERFDRVPFFWSAHRDVSISYIGHAERPDHAVLSGDVAAHDLAVRYEQGGQLRALATMQRDRESLEMEIAMEAAIGGGPPADEATRRFIDQLGALTEEDGVPRIAGRIFGYLLLEPEERSLDQIADALAVSRASVSTDARRLAELQLLERRSRPADRRDYYAIAPSGFRRLIERRIAAMQRFHTLLVEARALPYLAPAVRERLAMWDSAHEELLSAFTAVLGRLDREPAAGTE